ncbi:MAG: hypothetical protein LBL74_05735 [Bacteroidales bacterium]|jgi:hypothetical protein|nr:hypothetical protein [Bacteroidales bacterium]
MMFALAKTKQPFVKIKGCFIFTKRRLEKILLDFVRGELDIVIFILLRDKIKH